MPRQQCSDALVNLITTQLKFSPLTVRVLIIGKNSHAHAWVSRQVLAVTLDQSRRSGTRLRRPRMITAAPRSSRAVITNDVVDDPVLGMAGAVSTAGSDEPRSVDDGTRVVTEDGWTVVVDDAAVPCGVTAEDAVEGAEVPPVFTATAVNVYSVPLVKPDTVQLVAGEMIMHVCPPGFEVTVNESGVPPADEDTVTFADLSPATADTILGMLGGDAATAETPGSTPTAGPMPKMFAAATPKLYEMAGLRPVMMAGKVGLNTLMGSPPDVGVAETKYPVIAEPPVAEGGSALTDVVLSPAV